jgi:hypothetical protein
MTASMDAAERALASDQLEPCSGFELPLAAGAELLDDSTGPVANLVEPHFHGGTKGDIALLRDRHRHELIFLPLKLNPVQFAKLFDEDFFEQHIGQLAAAQRDGLGGREIRPAQVL